MKRVDVLLLFLSWLFFAEGLAPPSAGVARVSHLARGISPSWLSNFHHGKGALKSATSADSFSGDDEDIGRLKRKLTREGLAIALPALIQLAAEPLASIVDTAYLGRLGPEVLGGAGVAISAQYAVSKLYNDPLLRTSISLVASQDGKSRSNSKETKEEAKKELSVAVSSALLLAFCVGVIQLFVFTVLSSGIIRSMGLDATNPMWYSALSYLKVRALGTPAATLWLVTNGIFRGLGDTRTPLVYSLFFTALNAVLDPFFIFTLKFGASGAAAGTAIAQYVALVPLMMSLNRKVDIDIFDQIKELGKSLKSYLEAGSYVLFRTMGKVLAYSVCARQAAMLGSVAAAAYNLTFQLGFATTQICEAVAVAVQTLLARELADMTSHSPKVKAQCVQHCINSSILFGGGVASLLSLTTYLQRSSILAGMTTNLAVRQAADYIMPAVLACQICKGLAYPINGIIMGGLDWKFTMICMWVANFACVGLLKAFSMGGVVVSLNKIWIALTVFMGTQCLTGVLRTISKTGVWKLLRAKEPQTAS